MKRNVGLTYVKDFSFPAEQGFTGSTGKAKGYKRGGAVKKMPCGGAVKKMPRNVKHRGGEVRANMGGFMGPEREIQVDDVTITTPRAKGGYMKGGMHDKLKKAGAEMGYMYGGAVKNTSAQFKMKRGKQKTMDHGVQPARRGRNQAEIEAGGTKRLKPGLSHGGHIKGRADSGGGALADAALTRAKRVLKGRTKLKAPERARAASAKGMPKNVKSHGGAVRKPYSGYNKQPGGSGIEDSRYMMGKARGGSVKK